MKFRPAAKVRPPCSASPREYNYATVLILVTNLPAVGANYPIAQVTLRFQICVNWNMPPGADPNPYIYSYIYTNVFYTNTTPPYKYTNWCFTNYTVHSSNQPSGLELFLSLTNRFTDMRQYQTNMFVTQIDVGAYSNWLGTNTFILKKFNSATFPSSFTWRTSVILGPTSLPWCVSSMVLNCPSTIALALLWPPPIRYTSRAITT